MKILSVDTSSSVCTVALLEDDRLINENILDNGKTHSENFMPLLDKTLKDSNVSLDDIELIACCVGPGSFTGIRIGIASIKAIAEVKSLPVISVTSLESLAYNENMPSGIIVPMIDARNEQVYAGVFDYTHNKCLDYMACSVDEAIEKVLAYAKENGISDVRFVGSYIDQNRDMIIDNFKGFNVSFSSNNKQSSVSLGICAYNKFLKKDSIESADTLNPVYLRKSQAERMKNAGK